MNFFIYLTIFLLKCGIIPVWEIRLHAYKMAYRVWDFGPPSNMPVEPYDDRDSWVDRNWTNFVEYSKNQLKINRPRF